MSLLKPYHFVLLMLAIGALVLFCSASTVRADIEPGLDVQPYDRGFLLDEKDGETTVYTSYVGNELSFSANEYEGDNYRWDFGDGKEFASNSSSTRHNYSRSDLESYTITLNITKNDEQEEFSARISILDHPEARYSVREADGGITVPVKEVVDGKMVDVFVFEEGEKFILDASQSTGFGVYEYEWDFWVVSGQFNSASPGSGTYGRKMDTAVLKYIFPRDGIYPVMLKIKDDNKQLDFSDEVYIKVLPAPEKEGDDVSAGNEIWVPALLSILLAVPFLFLVLFKRKRSLSKLQEVRPPQGETTTPPELDYLRSPVEWKKEEEEEDGPEEELGEVNPDQEMEYSGKFRKGPR